MCELVRSHPGDAADLREFLARADLTLSGLDAPGVHLWLLRDSDGQVQASTGFELSDDGRHALVRSVAVDHDHRGRGLGLQLARFALAQAQRDGAGRAWLFSRRSGPFWRRLGFEPADRAVMAEALSGTHQVELFQRTGQLDHEVAWSRPLDDPSPHAQPLRAQVRPDAALR